MLNRLRHAEKLQKTGHAPDATRAGLLFWAIVLLALVGLAVALLI